MNVENIHERAEWFASYMNAPDGGNDQQGQALVYCQKKKIEQLQDLLERIQGEIELADEPKEYNERQILDSIRAMIEDLPQVEHRVGYFKWIG